MTKKEKAWEAEQERRAEMGLPFFIRRMLLKVWPTDFSADELENAEAKEED